MVRSLAARTLSTLSMSIITKKAASRRCGFLARFFGMTTPSHHKCAAQRPPGKADGAAANAILPTTLDTAASSMRDARLAHNTPMAALPCCNWFITSSELLASALGVMCGNTERIISMALTPASF